MRVRLSRLLLSLPLSIGLLWIFVTVTPVCGWWAKHLSGRWTDGRGDILIVPGAETVDRMIGISSYWRSVYAVRYWRRGGFREIVITGGGESGSAISELMRDFLVSQKVPAEVIRIETRSTSTHENAEFTRALLADTPGRKVLLTSDFHMFRALRAFQKAGLDVEPCPIPDAQKSAVHWMYRWDTFQRLTVETAKIGYYWIKGWI
jgi:uncharacterized SAM-binding protein YcdF (DUF218 family)